MDKNWYAIYVNSRSEKKVHGSLIKKGIESYIPLRKTLKQWSDRKKWVEEPLINGYVFVKINSLEREKVFTVNGIVNFLRFNNKDAIVREEEINSLKKIVNLGYSFEMNSMDKNYKKGDLVKIVDGPLKGFEGTINELEKNAKIEIVLSSIGQIIKATVPLEIVLLNN